MGATFAIFFLEDNFKNSALKEVGRTEKGKGGITAVELYVVVVIASCGW